MEITFGPCNFLIVTVLIILLVYFLVGQENHITNFEQFGGKVNYESDFLNEIRRDRDKYFRYYKGTFPYIDEFHRTYENNQALIKNRQKKIEQILNDYDKASKLLADLGKINNIRPMYSESDIQRKEKEMARLRDLYNQHLNSYLNLSNLNSQLLLLYIYSKNENGVEIDRLTNQYRKSKRQFLRSYRHLVK